MSRLALYLFGPPRIELDGKPIKINRYKAIALMAYLAMTAKTHSRNTLATLLWPDQDQSRARAALRRVLVTLNQANLGAWLTVSRETISLNQTKSLWFDIAQFQRHLANCLASKDDADTTCLPLLTQAVKLYHADFMAGFSLRDSPNFDEWQFFQTESLRRDLASTLAQLVRRLTNQGEHEAAIAYARRWLALDPLYELAHRRLMQLYTLNNQRSAALRQYQECTQFLKHELGVLPAEETSALYQRILHGSNGQIPEQKPLARQAAPPRYATLPLYNFPAQLTPFIDRKEALLNVKQRLHHPDCRLLTLTGPGGIGKTRLAIQIGLEPASSFPDGLYFVSLAAVASPDSLIPAICDNLNLPVPDQENPQQLLLKHLKNKKTLLILDNFDHLVKAAGLLTTILPPATDLKILVTSRERLNLQGEWTFEVKGMGYPQVDEGEALEAYEAVALFLQKAYRVNSEFSLTKSNGHHIIRICRLVQGVPLSIELAASWVRALSVQEIAHEIEQMIVSNHNLDFLTTPLQDVPEQHQSARAVFERSWQLLLPEEKRVFRQLSVFRGRYRREAIEVVTGADLKLVSTLIDKSLLIRPQPEQYEMPELYRLFAAEKLQQIPEEYQAVQQRHCDFYASSRQSRDLPAKGVKRQETLIESVGS